MKLSKEQIEFIDTYLKNTNVFYVDIRFEMIDHIASTVEETMQSEDKDFYDAFKEYMIKNKSEIVKQNNEKLSFSWIETKKFLLFLVKPQMLFLGFLLVLLYRLVDLKNFFYKSYSFGNMLFLLMLTIGIFQAIYYFAYLKKRFYCLEKSGQTLLIIYYILFFFKKNDGLIELFVFYLIVAYLLYSFNEIKKFYKREKFIA